MSLSVGCAGAVGDDDGLGVGGEGAGGRDQSVDPASGAGSGSSGGGASNGPSGAGDDADDAGAGGGAPMAGKGDRGDDVPDSAHCADVADWDPLWAQYEDEVLVLTNEARAQGQNCGSEGSFGPASALSMEPRLRCAARLHSLYMAEVADDFDHVTKAGVDPFERVQMTGYAFRAAGENIAVGSPSPREVVNGWIDSDGHCANLMSTSFTEIGIGYAFGRWDTNQVGVVDAPYWTQKFATPR
jgi:uncharacterized protein YkwD